MRTPTAALLALALVACDDGEGGAPAPDAGLPAPDAAGEPAAVAVVGVEPDRLPPRGGELRITGRGFAEPLTARLGGAPLEILEVGADFVRALAPALPVGPADLALTVEGHPTVVVRGAVRIEAASLAFARGLPERVEAPEAGEIRDAVAFDADLDRDPDLVLATDDGLRLLLNDGAGGFTLARAPRTDEEEGDPPPARPGGRGEVRALAVLPGDGDHPPVLVVCTGAARDRVLRAAPTGLEPAVETPLRRGVCRAVAVGDLDADGTAELAFLVEDGDAVGLHVLPIGTAAPSFADTFAPPAEAPTPIGSASSTDPDATVAFERVPGDAAEGTAAAEGRFATVAADAEVVFALPAALPAMPDFLGLNVWLDADARLRLRLVDAAGAAFEGPPLATGPAWSAVGLRDVAEWPRADGAEGAPEPPIDRIEFVVAVPAPGEGRLRVDAVVALRDGEMPRLIDDFERREPRFAWPDARHLSAGDLDGDGRTDLLVLRGEAPPALLRSAPVATGAELPLREHPVHLREPGTLVDGALLDADRDGDLDALLVASDGPDRLLVGDGFGRLLDATAGSLPIGWAEGRAVAAADVDGDGLEDVVIGNAGSTDRLYLARGDGRFLDATPDLGFDDLDTAAVVIADLDSDGDLDVVSVPRSGESSPLIRFAVEPPP